MPTNGPGYCVVVGTPANCPKDATELRTFAALNNSTLDGLGTLDTIGILTFSPRGLLVGVPGSLDSAKRATRLAAPFPFPPSGACQPERKRTARDEHQTYRGFR
jgi:hypothetical protein